MIDQIQLKAIAGDCPELILEILMDFHEEAKRSIAKVTRNVLDQHFGEAKDAFHQLAGASGTLGLSKLRETILGLEAQCKDCSASPDSVSVLQAILEKSVDEAKRILSQL